MLLASDKIESYTQVKPTSKSGQTISYGPYESVKPFEQVITLKDCFTQTMFNLFCNLEWAISSLWKQ